MIDFCDNYYFHFLTDSRQQLLSQLFKTELHLPMHFYSNGFKSPNVIRRCHGIKRFSK